MTDLRERVARAICERLGDDWNREGPVGLMEAYGGIADAAIAAAFPQHEVAVYGMDGSRTVEMQPVPLTAKGKPCCSSCETPLDIPGRPWTRSCGGDCLACMADAVDPECFEAMGRAAILPPGWRAVPEEPTEEMQVAGAEAVFNGSGDASDAYRAMVSAAPTTPAAAEEKAP